MRVFRIICTQYVEQLRYPFYAKHLYDCSCSLSIRHNAFTAPLRARSLIKQRRSMNKKVRITSFGALLGQLLCLFGFPVLTTRFSCRACYLIVLRVNVATSNGNCNSLHNSSLSSQYFSSAIFQSSHRNDCFEENAIKSLPLSSRRNSFSQRTIWNGMKEEEKEIS